jgi:hypothetical protein
MRSSKTFAGVPVLAASCSLYRVWKGFSARNGFAKMGALPRFSPPSLWLESIRDPPGSALDLTAADKMSDCAHVIFSSQFL